MDDLLIKVEEFAKESGEKEGGNGMTIMMPMQNPQPPCVGGTQSVNPTVMMMN
jgi:hypothetical protein